MDSQKEKPVLVTVEAIDMRKEDKAKDEWKEMLNKWTMNFIINHSICYNTL